jgi:hypothetical protein
MDYSRTSCPEAMAILATGVRIVIHQAMTDAYIESMANAVNKVARHYAA